MKAAASKGLKTPLEIKWGLWRHITPPPGFNTLIRP
jgi:hypothetical protein